MFNTLCDYFLLKEVTKVTSKNTKHYASNFKEKIIVLRHARYIKRDCIEYKYRKDLTDLYNMIPLKEFADCINISKGPLEQKIEFMRIHNTMTFFEYKEIEGITYIYVDEELKQLLKKYTPFIAFIGDDYTKIGVKAYYYFAGYCIGFY